jgi:hypothetical protein
VPTEFINVYGEEEKHHLNRTAKMHVRIRNMNDDINERSTKVEILERNGSEIKAKE